MLHIRLSRTLIVLALLITVLVPLSAAAHVVFGVGVGPIFPWGYYGYYGPYGYGYPYGWGYPAYYGGGYAYGPYGYGYGYGRPVGEVQIKSPDPNAQIYINGALAGRAHDLKKMYLKPGTYTIEQRIGNDVQKERVYIVANRSLKIEFGKPGTHSSTPPPSAPPPSAVPPVPEEEQQYTPQPRR